MPGFSFGGNSIGGGSQFGNMGSNDPYGNGDTTSQGGGGNGNSDNNNTDASGDNTATQRQYTSIHNDQAFMERLTNLIKAGYSINPDAKFQISQITPSGSMTLSVTGLTLDQAEQIGLSGLLMGYNANGIAYAVGNIETGHTRPAYHTTGGSNGSSSGSRGMTAAQLAASSLGLFLKSQEEAASAAALAAANAAAEAKRVADEEAQRQQAAWDAQHTEEAAQRQVNEAQQRIDQAALDKTAAEQRASGHDAAANNFQNEQNAFLQEQQRVYAEFMRYVNSGALNEVGSPRYRTAMQLQGTSNTAKANADAKQTDIDRERNAAAQARNEASQFQQQMEQYQQEKTEAENRLNALRQENLAKAQAEADARTAAEDKAKAEAAAKAQAAAAAAQEQAMRAREAAAARLSSPAVQSVRGIPAGATVTGSPLSWASAGGGGIALGEDIAVAFRAFISAAVAELNGIATASLVGPMAIAVGTLFFSKEAGAGSDQVPGRDISALMPGDTLSLPDAADLEHAADTNTPVSMPVRGRMVLRDDGSLETQLVRDSVAGSVPVVRASLDPETGYWGYTLPMMPGVPGQTILVSPADAPGVDGLLGLTGPVPLPERIIHTGGQVTVPQGVTTTTTPVFGALDFRDFILIFPAESGLKPLYVMQNSPYGKVTEKGKYSGRPYNPDEAGGPTQDLDWHGAVIDQVGIDKVKLHTGRFDGSADNEVMIGRLEKILSGELQVTDTDKRFYTHEIRELERYRVLGVPDGTVPVDENERSMLWNNTHTATLEDYKIKDDPSLLYTPEATEAYIKQEEGLNK